MSAGDVIRDALDRMDWGAAVDGDHTRGATYILAVLRGAGFAVVPVSPDAAMEQAAMQTRGSWLAKYRAMVAAAEPRPGDE